MQVDCTSDEKLNLPLLQFHEDASPELPLLAVNFDPALVALLRETKYFLLLQIKVPDAAAAIFERADTYRSQIGSLDLMVSGSAAGHLMFCMEGGGCAGMSNIRQGKGAMIRRRSSGCCNCCIPAACFAKRTPCLLPQVMLYNRIQHTILPVEKPLVEAKLMAVEASLKR